MRKIYEGTKFKVKNDLSETYTLTLEKKGDISNSIISVDSPLGSAIEGARQGEVIEVSTPVGILNYEVLEVIG